MPSQSQQSLAPRSVIIAGGSLASLMHALVLLSSPTPPHKILILERSPTELLHNQGAGIVASPELSSFFVRYYPEVNAGSAYDSGKRDIVARSRLRQYLDRSGAVMEGSVEMRGQRMTSWDLLYHLLRRRVDGLESRYVNGLLREESTHVDGRVEYRHGCTVSGVEDVSEKKVSVTWQERRDGAEQSEKVDLLIAADGASSTVRRLLVPEVKRGYVGYVAWRGTVPEHELSSTAKETLIETFTFFHAEATQALGYLIPGNEGTVTPGERLYNWVWYVNYEDGSKDLEELMTDVHGKRHAITLPVGGMQKQVWEKQKAYAAKILPPQFAEAVSKTRQPFIQAITDVISPRNSILQGKVLLVGDALAGFRPHTAASTGQAAFDALRLESLLSGTIDRQQYDSQVMDFAKKTQESGVTMGNRSQFGEHPFAA